MGISVSIVGASGYSGGELMRLLSSHKKVDEICGSAQRYAGKKFGEVHKNLKISGVFLSEPKLDADVVFTATPAGVAMEIAKKLDLRKQ